jgi:poly(3-hydroxybutyrate) depolymerase
VAYTVEFIRRLGPEVHVMAVCQPTVPVLGAVSLLATLGDPHQPRSMTLMGGPIDARRSPTQVTRLALDHPLSWFEDVLVYRVPAGYPGSGRRVYPGFLQLSAFVAMNPRRHAESYRNYFFDVALGRDERASAHRRFYDDYNAVLDMPAEYYLETVRHVFQEFSLASGRWTVRLGDRELRVAPEDVRTTALFTIEGELDDISGLGQTEAAQSLCRSIPHDRRRHLVAEGVGHYGLFSGRRWREQIYPEVRAFIRAS